jgi:PadR family transcriptional regulator PadR
MAKQINLLQGTLDLLILRVIARGPMHGWDIAQQIQLISRDVLQVQQGSLYPALHRLEKRGWITAEWGSSENNRRAKFYRLTESGHARMKSPGSCGPRSRESLACRSRSRSCGSFAVCSGEDGWSATWMRS